MESKSISTLVEDWQKEEDRKSMEGYSLIETKKTILIFPWAKKLRNDEKRNPKDYPFWPELVKTLREKGFRVIQVSLSGEDTIGADDLILDKPFKELSEMIKQCAFVITVDSMASHLSWYLKKKAVVLFGQSDPLIFGHSENLNLLKNRKYLRFDPFNIYEGLALRDKAFYSPDEVISKMKESGII